MRPFADSVVGYAQAGWPCVLPVPVAEKSPPPVGYTGADGADTDAVTLVRWAGTHADWSIALRMPDGVIGIDVDHYDKVSTLPDGTTKTVKKRGNDSLLEYIQRWGPLPPTWSSTARGTHTGVGDSRILFFRVPPGRYVTKLGQAIEIIQRHHRYAAVWPSSNPDAGGAQYRWYDPTGAVVDAPPKPVEFPWVPEAWVAGLREGATEAGPAAADASRGQALLGVLLADDRPPCAEVSSAWTEALHQLAGAESGSRHDTTTGRVHHLVQMGAAGHPGVGAALAALGEQWAVLTASEGREGEYERMMLTSARKAVTKVGASPVDRDPCPPAPVQTALAYQALAQAPDGFIAVDPARFTQSALAAEFANVELAGRYRWAKALGWLSWDGRRWAMCPEEGVVEKARLWATRMLGEAAGHLRAGRCDVKLISAWHAVAKTAASLRAIVSLARGIDGVIADAATFDHHPDLLNVGNGVVDLRTGALGPHDPELLLTKLAPVDFHPDAAHPDWLAALRALPADVLTWYQIRLGQSVTGHMTPDDVMVVQTGGGENGKTTVLAAVEKALGDYAVLVSDKVILGDPRQHSTERMELRGARFALIEETPEARRLAVSQLKKVLGTPTMTARYIAQNEVRWEATHSLWLSTNYRPLVEEVDHGTWRRLLELKFPYTYIKPPAVPAYASERTADPTLRDRMRQGRDKQHEAVLSWLIEGAKIWYASGRVMPPVPERVEQDTRDWRKDSDVILAYLDDGRVKFDPASHVLAADLLEDVNAWLAEHGARPWSDKLFVSRFSGHYEVTARHVERRAQRRNESLSRPPAGRVLTPLRPAPETYKAWHGLRFTGSPKPPATSTVTAVTATYIGPHVEVQNETSASCGNSGNVADSSRSAHAFNASKLVDQSGPTADPTDKAVAKTAKREQERAAKIADAAGKRIPLPAAADRAGNVVPLTVDDAMRAVRHTMRWGPVHGHPGVLMAGALTVDVETTGYPVGHANYALRTVQLGAADAAVVFDPADPDQADAIRALIAEAPKLHAHSATADLVPLAAAGLCDESAWKRMHDTVIPAKLADPESTGSDPGLKKLAVAVLGQDSTAPAADAGRDALFKAGRWLKETKADTPLERSGWAQVDSGCTTMIRYAASDVLDTAALAMRLPALPADLAERERSVQRVTARVAHRGLLIDGEQVARLRAKHTAALEGTATQVRAFGIENPGSGPQVATVMAQLGATLPQTPTGRPSVAEGVLTTLRGAEGDLGDLVRAVLDYRHHGTALSLFLEPYHQLVVNGDGRARPTVYTLSADTGRMSCVRPNLQQVPREGGFRSCITADPGHLLISADFSGVEVRVMAALSQDPNLIRMLAEGVDLHSVVAAQAFGPEFTKNDRYTAKRGVFGWAYGGGIPSLALQLGVSQSTMAAVVDSLALVAPRYVEWGAELKGAVRRGATQMPTYAGRVIHLAKREPHKAPNYAIQGTARELLVDALLAWSQTPWGGSTVLPVHDEIVAMVPEAEAVEATAALVRCMATELYGVPIVAEADTPAYAWQDAV